jgi:hypothetical protein
MKLIQSLVIPSLVVLTGCAGLTPPSAEKLAALPVVTYPDKPAAGEFVYKLPAGKPIDVRILADGTALATGADQKVSASLAHDIYLHKKWASEDGQTWVAADKLIGINLTLILPSYETPGPGEMHLAVNRKPAK